MAKFCAYCGNPVSEGEVFCSNCGARLSGQAAEEQNPAVAPNPVPPENGYVGAPQNYIPDQDSTVRFAEYAARPVIPETRTVAPAKKSIAPLIACFVTVLVLIAAAAVLLFVYPGFLKDNGDGAKAAESVSTETEDAQTESAESEPGDVTTRESEEETEEVTETEKKEDVKVPSKSDPDFEKYGIAIDMQIGKGERMTTCCRDDTTKTTTGIVTIESYTREDVDDDILDFGEENGMTLDGYEVLRVSTSALFDDENALKYGVLLYTSFEDYYNIDLLDDSAEEFTDSYGDDYFRYEVEWNGEKNYVYLWLTGEQSGDEDYVYIEGTRTYLVPRGYDGAITGFVDGSRASFDDYDHIYEGYDEDDYRLFRLK